MTRLVLASLLLTLLLSLLLPRLEVSSDVSDIAGGGQSLIKALDSVAGRSLVVAIEHEDLSKRNGVLRAAAALLDAHPDIQSVRFGPQEASQPLLDWLWRYRLVLGTPNFDPGQMAERLRRGQVMLMRAEGMVLGGKLLSDPTGAFLTLLNRLERRPGSPKAADGVWQSKDGRAALILARFRDAPFEPGPVMQLVSSLGDLAGDARIHVIGPRVISARINAETTSGARMAAIGASVFLLLWLIFVLKDARGFVLALLPVALGGVTAIICVQLIFGPVHVIALGFGGTLLGLSLDYPLHLLGQPQGRQAQNFVLIGAMTTAAGFLAMLGSGVVALMQTGVFVAAGLIAAALCARILIAGESLELRSFVLPRWRWPGRGRPWVELVLAILALAVIWRSGTPEPRALFEPPEDLTASMEKLADWIDLPSERYSIRVEADNLQDLLKTQAELRPLLDDLVQSGQLGGYRMDADMLGDGGNADLPSPADFAALAKQALLLAAMSPDYATTQLAEYQRALEQPALSAQDIQELPELSFALARLEIYPGHVRSEISLFNPIHPEALTWAVGGAQLADAAGPLTKGLSSLRHEVLIWLGIGGLASMITLLAGLRDPAATLRLALTTLATAALTGALMSIWTGPLDIFQIVALTLVVGISIDYGLFLRGPRENESTLDNGGSVALCAGSTIIAFAFMTASPIRLLHEIGLTVVLGVMLALSLHLAKSR